MKTCAIEVYDMPSKLNVLDVERRIGKVPGVESVTATVRYDETRLESAGINSVRLPCGLAVGAAASSASTT